MLKENGIKIDVENDKNGHRKQPNGYVTNNCGPHVKNGQLGTDMPEVIFLEISKLFYRNRNIENIR